MKPYDITSKGEEYVDDFQLRFVGQPGGRLHGDTKPSQPLYDIFKLLWVLRKDGSLWKYMEEIRKTRGGESKGLQLIQLVEEKGLIEESQYQAREMDPDIQWEDSMYGARPTSSELRRHRAAQTGTIDKDTWHEYEPDLSREYLEELEKI